MDVDVPTSPLTAAALLHPQSHIARPVRSASRSPQAAEHFTPQLSFRALLHSAFPGGPALFPGAARPPAPPSAAAGFFSPAAPPPLVHSPPHAAADADTEDEDEGALTRTARPAARARSPPGVRGGGGGGPALELPAPHALLLPRRSAPAAGAWTSISAAGPAPAATQGEASAMAVEWEPESGGATRCVAVAVAGRRRTLHLGDLKSLSAHFDCGGDGGDCDAEAMDDAEEGDRAKASLWPPARDLRSPPPAAPHSPLPAPHYRRPSGAPAFPAQDASAFPAQDASAFSAPDGGSFRDQREGRPNGGSFDGARGSASRGPRGGGGGGRSRRPRRVLLDSLLACSQSHAARVLDVPLSTLSRHWKAAVGERKWPYRKLCKVDRLMRELEKSPRHDPEQAVLLQHLARERRILLEPVFISL